MKINNPKVTLADDARVGVEEDLKLYRKWKKRKK